MSEPTDLECVAKLLGYDRITRNGISDTWHYCAQNEESTHFMHEWMLAGIILEKLASRCRFPTVQDHAGDEQYGHRYGAFVERPKNSAYGATWPEAIIRLAAAVQRAKG